MDGQTLLLVIAAVSFTCYALERRIAWLMHVSAVCLIILTAMILSQSGLIPSQHEVYGFLKGPVVLIAIVLMTVGLHLSDVRSLPWRTIALFGVGSLGSMLGGLLAGFVAAPDLGVDAHKLAAQLTASYIGGGENAVAMQKILDIPQAQFVAIFAVDNLATSLWMAFAVWYASDREKEVSIREDDASGFDGANINIVSLLGSIAVAFGVVVAATIAAQHIGGLHKILYMSIFALAVGHIPGLREYLRPSYLLGAVLFAGFFFSIGAVSDLRSVMDLPPKIVAMPFIVVGVHGVIIVIAARLLGVSRLTTGVVTQSLIGGPATAVAVAQVRKWRSGISVGIILGVLGYAIANFYGVAVFEVLQAVQPIG